MKKKRRQSARADFFENVRTGGRRQRRNTRVNRGNMHKLASIKDPQKGKGSGVTGKMRTELELDGILPPSSPGRHGVVVTPRSSYIRLCQEMKVLPDSRLLMRGDVSNEYDFSGIQCNAKQMEAGLRALTENQTTSHISLLNLSSNNFDQRSMETLMKLISHLDISDLDLSANDVGAGAMVPLGKLLASPQAEMRELNLSQVGLSGSSIGDLCKGLQGCHSLRRLNLSHNALSNASLVKIASTFMVDSSLIEIDVSWNRAKQAIEKFFMIPGLQSLNLSMNPIPDSAVGKVCPLLEDHKTLLHLDLSGTSIETPGLTRLARALTSNHVLIDIYLSNLKGCEGQQDSLGFVSVITSGGGAVSPHHHLSRQTSLTRDGSKLFNKNKGKVKGLSKSPSPTRRRKRPVIRAKRKQPNKVTVVTVQQRKRTASVVCEKEAAILALPKGGWLKLPHISHRLTRFDTNGVHYHGTIAKGAKTDGKKPRSCCWLQDGWSEVTLEIRDTDVANLFKWHHDQENRIFTKERPPQYKSAVKSKSPKGKVVDPNAKSELTKEELDQIRLLPPLQSAHPEEDQDALHHHLKHLNEDHMRAIKAGDLLQPDAQIFVHWEVDGYQAWGLSRVESKRKRKRKKKKKKKKPNAKEEPGVWRTSRIIPPGRQHFFFSFILDGVKVSTATIDQRFVLEKRYFVVQQTWLDGQRVEVKPNASPQAKKKGGINRTLNFVDVMWREGPFASAVCVPRPGSRMNMNNWDLMNSVFIQRIKEADSRHFFDIPSVYSRAFENDWRLSNAAAIITGKKANAYDGNQDPKKLDESPEVKAVRHVMKKQYKRLMDIFTYEGALGMALQSGQNTLQTWSWGTFSSFVRKIKIFHPKYLNHNDADIIFITCNVRVKSERSGPDRFLARYEFLQLLLRLAMRRFVWPKKVKSIAAGLELILRDHVYPNCKDAPDRDKWRRERLYTQAVSNLYLKHLNTLRKIYQGWSETADEAYAAELDGSMSFGEWTAMMLATGLVVQTGSKSPQKKSPAKAKRFGKNKRSVLQSNKKGMSSLRKKRLEAKRKRAEEAAAAEAEDDDEAQEGRVGNLLMKLHPMSELHIRTSFIFSQMWVKNHNTTVKHKRMTFTDFLEGVGRIADKSYTITKLPKPPKVKTDSDDSDESSSDDDDEDDIDLNIKLEDFLPKYIFPLIDKAVKPTAGR